MTAPLLPKEAAKRHWLQRALIWAAGALLCLLLIAVAARVVLIRQMRLPRLTLAQSGIVTAVAVSPDGQTIFAGAATEIDKNGVSAFRPADVFIWSACNGRLIRRLPGFHWRSSGVLVSPDGRFLVAFGEAYQTPHGMTPFQVIDWNWQSSQKRWMVASGLPISYSPDGRFVGCENGVYDAASGRLICRMSTHAAEDGQSAFTPDGKWYGIIDTTRLDPKTKMEREPPDEAYTYSTTRLHFWRTDTGREAKDLPYTRVRAFDIARNGQWLVMTSDAPGVIGGTDGSVVRRVDIQTGKVLWTRERSINGPDADPEAVLNSVAVSPNGKYVVLASTDNHLIVLDAETGREMVPPLCFSRSGRCGLGHSWRPRVFGGRQDAGQPVRAASFGLGRLQSSMMTASFPILLGLFYYFSASSASSSRRSGSARATSSPLRGRRVSRVSQ